jgi:hypothetical protein
MAARAKAAKEGESVCWKRRGATCGGQDREGRKEGLERVVEVAGFTAVGAREQQAVVRSRLGRDGCDARQRRRTNTAARRLRRRSDNSYSPMTPMKGFMLLQELLELRSGCWH